MAASVLTTIRSPLLLRLDLCKAWKALIKMLEMLMIQIIQIYVDMAAAIPYEL